MYRVSKRKRISDKKDLTMSSVPKSLVVSDRFFTRLTYTQDVTFTVGSTATSLIFSGSSIYNPDITLLTGGLPVGYTQLMDIYAKYRVFASTIKFSASPVLNVVLRSALTAIDDPNNEYTDINTLTSNPFSAQRVIILDQIMENEISMRMSTDKFFGVNHKALSVDDRFSALAGYPPATEWYWQLMLNQLVPGGSTIRTVSGTVEITYEVEFFQRLELPING